jgi:hypothetical protein
MAKTRVEKSVGLGDTIDKITKTTGIKAVVKKVSELTGWDCGCEERKETLNKLFPYVKPNCLIEEDFNYLKDLFSTVLNELTINQQYEIRALYERVFGVKLDNSNCASCWRDTLEELKKVYNAHLDDENRI